jgi:hypothetical protein
MTWSVAVLTTTLTDPSDAGSSQDHTVTHTVSREAILFPCSAASRNIGGVGKDGVRGQSLGGRKDSFFSPSSPCQDRFCFPACPDSFLLLSA